MIGFIFQAFFLAVHFGSLEMEAKSRWESFASDRSFKPFEPNRSDEELAREFEEIRLRRWESDEFKFAGQLIDRDLVREGKCCAFAYNNTDANYNASTVYVGNCRMIVCEGPREKDVYRFFDLIGSQGVTHLVRLTAAAEGDVEKCYPYWNAPIPTPVRTFQLDQWQDNCGIDPEELLAFVLEVRKELASDEQNLLLVHCSAGVGRSGTFLAAWAILDAIEAGQPFSIEEIVYRLSLQRIRSVARRDQYITLHKLAEIKNPRGPACGGRG